ncbi:unnamed protein product [Caenorhabditis brenneri]
MRLHQQVCQPDKYLSQKCSQPAEVVLQQPYRVAQMMEHFVGKLMLMQGGVRVTSNMLSNAAGESIVCGADGVFYTPGG